MQSGTINSLPVLDIIICSEDSAIVFFYDVWSWGKLFGKTSDHCECIFLLLLCDSQVQHFFVLMHSLVYSTLPLALSVQFLIPSPMFFSLQATLSLHHFFVSLNVCSKVLSHIGFLDVCLGSYECDGFHLNPQFIGAALLSPVTDSNLFWTEVMSFSWILNKRDTMDLPNSFLILCFRWILDGLTCNLGSGKSLPTRCLISSIAVSLYN